MIREADHAAQLLRHGLHAVADAQHGHALLEHGVRHAHGALFVGRGVAAGQDDALQALRHLVAHEGVVDVAGVHFRIDADFADAAGNQLGDLRTIVKNEDALVHEETLPVMNETAVNKTAPADPLTDFAVLPVRDA